MCKKLYFLISFVLVLGLSGLAQAAAIDVNNPSFELGTDGNQVTSHADLGVGWEQGGTGFVGVDAFCPYATVEPCHNWPGSDDPNGFVFCYIQNTGSAYIYQVLDINNSDANAVIEAGRRYELTFDSLTEKISPSTITASFFYGDNPDANQLASETYTLEIMQRPMEDCTDPEPDPGPTVDYCRDWNYDLRLRFVAEASGDYLGETLGIKFATPSDDNYNFVDNVRLEWAYMTYAYEPSPADGEVDVSRDATLSWKAGGYTQSTDGHDVYFGTDYNSVRDADELSPEYKGSFDLDVNYYDPCSGQLNLGQMYYWRVDEVNDAYTAGWEPGDEPPPGPWKGDVWSFEITGYARNPSPADGAVDIPSLNLTLSWDAATEATSYDVYFGADYNSVRDADDSGPPGPTEIYRSHQSGLSYVVPEALTTGLDVGGTYYWRIDPAGGADLTGQIWSFTIGEFLIVDDMESYDASINKIDKTWEDYWVNGSGAQVFLTYNDVNHMRSPDSQSMELIYDNPKSTGTCDSSYTDANPAALVIGTDWTVGNVKSITLFWLGDPCNVIPDGDYEAVRLWVELEDTSNNSYLAKYGDLGEDAGDIQVAEWHQWYISLLEYENAGVDLSSLARVTIGIGGTDYTGQSKASEGTIWIDDIHLYPPKCLPEISEQTGDFTEDCTVDSYDLDIMATDWLLTDGERLTENQPATLTGFPDATSHWVDGHIGGAIDVNEDYNIDVTDPRLNGLASMSITAWVKQTIINNWAGIVSSREEVGCGDDATEIGIYGGEYGGPGEGALGYDWSCGEEEWQHIAGLIVPSDGTWTFVAISVDPTGGSLYMRPAGGALQTGIRNTDAHDLQQNFSESFYIGRSGPSGGYMVGAIDDVRIYAYALDFNDVDNLAYEIADPNPWPVYHYEFDETTGYTAADTGTPTIVYSPVPSVANLADPEPKLERVLNFVDYALFADNWLEESLWPY